MLNEGRPIDFFIKVPVVLMVLLFLHFQFFKLEDGGSLLNIDSLIAIMNNGDSKTGGSYFGPNQNLSTICRG